MQVGRRCGRSASKQLEDDVACAGEVEWCIWKLRDAWWVQNLGCLTDEAKLARFRPRLFFLFVFDGMARATKIHTLPKCFNVGLALMDHASTIYSCLPCTLTAYDMVYDSNQPLPATMIEQLRADVSHGIRSVFLEKPRAGVQMRVGPEAHTGAEDYHDDLRAHRATMD